MSAQNASKRMIRTVRFLLPFPRIVRAIPAQKVYVRIIFRTHTVRPPAVWFMTRLCAAPVWWRGQRVLKGEREECGLCALILPKRSSTVPGQGPMSGVHTHTHRHTVYVGPELAPFCVVGLFEGLVLLQTPSSSLSLSVCIFCAMLYGLMFLLVGRLSNCSNTVCLHYNPIEMFVYLSMKSAFLGIDLCQPAIRARSENHARLSNTHMFALWWYRTGRNAQYVSTINRCCV